MADMNISKELTDHFKERMGQTRDTAEVDLNFSIMVLSTNFWPLNPPSHGFTMPREINVDFLREDLGSKIISNLWCNEDRA